MDWHYFNYFNILDSAGKALKMIRLNKVSFEYDNEERRVGVYNINLRIPKGQVVMICGASGSGKTTLTRLINGLALLYFPGTLTGQILLDGTDIKYLSSNEIFSKIGTVFQNSSAQFFNVNTTDEIAFGCENIGVPNEEIFERIGKVTRELSIEALLDKNLFTLSEGEKKKVACAAVAAMDTQVLLLDEPTSNLDLSTLGDLKDMIRNWKKRGKTVIIVEHRLYFLKDLVDRVIFMERGRIRLDLPIDEFKKIDVERLHQMGLRSQRRVRFFPQRKKFSDADKENFYFSDLKFSYGRENFLNIPKIHIPLGSVVGVLGYNGSGKSTFAKAICGFEKGAGGTAFYKGRKLGPRARRRLCYMVMQDVNNQFFTESVLEEIMLSMENEKEDTRLGAEVILHELNLEMYQETSPFKLSGGQKQRAALGSAIAANRELLILDEPTGGLDYRHMMEVVKIVKKFSMEGRTIFLITNDPELLKECCDYLIFLDNGQLSWSGEWTEENTERVNEFFEGV